MFADYIVGKGSFIISRELNQEGERTVDGGKWHTSTSTVLGILKNEKYKGDSKLQNRFNCLPDSFLVFTIIYAKIQRLPDVL
ncbi:recombinase family protein [Sporomusa silvacetica]|uniref:recombinase family protein n=1 Tax=Sporomusa silvacetica TaxID=55504 RepID=UPI001B80CDB9